MPALEPPVFTLLRIGCAVGIIFYLSPLRDPEKPLVTAAEAALGLSEALRLLPDGAQERVLSEIAATALAHGIASRDVVGREPEAKGSIRKLPMDTSMERKSGT
jgi:hypothetical protein